MIKLIAFDWNGTLLSDTNLIVKADNIVLKKLNKKPITVTKFRQSFKVPILKYWPKVGISESDLKKNRKIINDLFHNSYEPLADKSRTRTGSRVILDWLKNNNIESTIYSNHTTPNIHRQLKRLKLDHLITEVLAREIGDDSHYHKNSKEEKLLNYIKKHKFKPHEVVSVGDTEEEIDVGKKFGYHTVAITGGYNTNSRLKKAKPDFLIHNMLELKKIIQKLNRE